MSITHEAYLNIVPGDSPAPIIKVSQYDADFSIVFHLIAKKRGIVPAYPRAVENDEDVTINMPTSATVSVRGTKTDGNGYSAAATLSGTATAPIVTVAGHEQMTASAGVNVYEITFYADNATKRLSTANFILFVEPAALDASTITSESLMLELNDLIASVPNAVAAADRAEAAAAQFEIDATLTQQGKPADAKKVGDEISDLKADFNNIFSDEAKQALLDLLGNVAYINGNGQNYYDALEDALYPSLYPKIEVVYQPGSNIIYPSTSINSLKQYLTVKYYDSASSQGQVIQESDYSLSGVLTVGKSVITVAYNDCTVTFVVPVFDIMIDGYDSSNTSVVQNPGTYALYYNDVYTYDYTHKVSKIKLYAETVGQLSLGIVSATSIQDNKIIDSFATLSQKDTINIDTTGEQIVDLPHPFIIPDGHYLVVGIYGFLPGVQDTCKWRYGSYGTQKGFAYNNGASTRSLGVNIYVGG